MSRLLSFCLLLLVCGCGFEPARHTLVLADAKPLVVLAGLTDESFVALDGPSGGRWTGVLAPGTASLLADTQGVRFVEPALDYTMEVSVSPRRISRQWALEAIGATRAQAGVLRGRQQPVVALIGPGVDPGHPALASALWTNPGEIPSNGLDDDANGFIDDVRGWDFVDGGAAPWPSGDVHFDPGTHMASVIAGTGRLGQGIAGVAPGSLVMSLRVSESDRTDGAALADALDYAVANGADVIHLAFAGGHSRLVAEALDRALEAGIAVVAPAGDREGARAFPASHPGVISVIGTGEDGRLAPSASTAASIAAPGVDVLGAAGPRGAAAFSGSAVAAAHVAGALALARQAGVETGKWADLIACQPAGPDDLPILDVPSLLGRASQARAGLHVRRSRLSFHHAGVPRDFLARTLAVEASTPQAFDVEAPGWIRVGTCRTAPCQLEVDAVADDLPPGLHTGRLELRPVGGAPVTVWLDLTVGQLDPSPRVVGEVDGLPADVAEALVVTVATPFALQVVAFGRPTAVEWRIDGQRTAGALLRGAFLREGRYMLSATHPDGRQLAVEVIAVNGGAL